MTRLCLGEFKVKYHKFGTYTGFDNMRIDSEILEDSIANSVQEPIFRLYAWSPKSVSLGRNQADNLLDEKINQLNKKLPYESRIDCVKRLTGGRALLHDDEITYSFVAPVTAVPDGKSVVNSYKYISGILIDFFKTLGVELNFGESNKVSTHFNYCMLISTGADVCYKGLKIIGSAQCRKQGYILQHGSILFDYDKELLEELFGEEIQGMTTVKEILPNMTKEEFVLKFEEYIKFL